MEQRVLVCGGRDYDDRERLFSILDTAHMANPIVDLVVGDARGADSLARAWATERKVRMDVYLADWDYYGNNAGPIRNQEMLDQGKPHLVIAFPGGKGTADMMRRAKKASVPVVRVRPCGTVNY